MLLDKASLGVRHACAIERTRYSLHAIHVTPRETQATNGKLLARVQHAKVDEDLFAQTTTIPPAPTITEPFLLDAKHAGIIEEAIIKDVGERSLARKKPILRHANVEPGPAHTATVVARITDLQVGRTIVFPKAEGQFPNVDIVTPTAVPDVEVTLDTALIEQLARVARACLRELGDKQSPKFKLGIYLSSGGEAGHHKITVEKALKVTCLAAPRFSGVLLPITLE